jgi:hypothetical protein
MPRIVLTEEQARAIEQAGGSVEVFDERGNLYGMIKLELTAEQFAEIKRRMATPGPRIPGERVQAHLQALQAEWDRLGGFDEAYMKEFLARLQAEDAR